MGLGFKTGKYQVNLTSYSAAKSKNTYAEQAQNL